MLLGFQSRFEPFILDGTKTCTIRSERKRLPRTGEICHCYGDVRRKTMHLLGRFPCTKVESLRIDDEPGSDDPPYDLQVRMEGQKLDRVERNALAWQDGFRSGTRRDAFAGMAEFWRKVHGKGKPLHFRGHCIHWQHNTRNCRS